MAINAIYYKELDQKITELSKLKPITSKKERKQALINYYGISPKNANDFINEFDIKKVAG